MYRILYRKSQNGPKRLKFYVKPVKIIHEYLKSSFVLEDFKRIGIFMQSNRKFGLNTFL